MRSSTSLQGSGLVRSVGPYAQTRSVAIETHSRTRGAKRRAFGRPAEQVTEPRAKREARWTALCRTC